MGKTITLIGEKLAIKNLEFQYLKPLLDCRDCKLKNVCFNLDEGKHYQIIGIRDKQHDCKLHDGSKVISVEVEEISYYISIPVKTAIAGSTISYQPIICDDISCENFCLCNPKINENSKIVIEKIEDEINCKKGKNLKKVLVK
jgi:uncharacterized protein (UPF0179 family)